MQILYYAWLRKQNKKHPLLSWVCGGFSSVATQIPGVCSNSLHTHCARFALWLLLFSAVNALVPIALEIWDRTLFLLLQQKRLPPSTKPPLLFRAEPPTPTPPARPSSVPSTCRPRPSVAALLCCLSLQAAQTPLADLLAIRDLQSGKKKLHPPGFCFLAPCPPPPTFSSTCEALGHRSPQLRCHMPLQLLISR